MKRILLKSVSVRFGENTTKIPNLIFVYLFITPA